jgi:hypothetical protein
MISRAIAVEYRGNFAYAWEELGVSGITVFVLPVSRVVGMRANWTDK